jgi:Uncharacterized protein conserved in bacteria
MSTLLMALCLSLQTMAASIPQPIPFEVTMYTSGYESTGKHPDHPAYGITASGAYVSHGTIAAGRKYPFGTRIYIKELDREFAVEDRGGAITDDHIDIWTDDLDEAILFGRRQLTGYVIKD